MFRKFLSYSLILVLFLACEKSSTIDFKAEKILSEGNRSFTKISLNQVSFELTDIRPSMSDTSLLLVVPVEMTQSLEKRKFGLSSFRGVCSGENRDASKKAGILTKEGSIELLDLRSDSTDLRGIACKPGVSFMQQHLLISEGEIQPVVASQSFQARVIVKYKDGKMALLESEQHLKMNQLQDDLKSMGVDIGVLLVNGLFAQGWYQYGGAQITLGRVKSSSNPQNNWLVVRP